MTGWGSSCRFAGWWELLLRHNWSCQQPVRRAVERDDAAVAGWLKETWAPGKATSLREICWSGWARTTAWPLCSREDFDDEFGDLLYAADWYVVSGGPLTMTTRRGGLSLVTFHPF
ncbi:winged helix-turn-helix domain-containing protein [Streptomyces sp. NPDC005283]|uniref:winged helix-turn-helix domain-containing protein n=1 Tax=Streptomyces sp. NPDC005283 TaxID=3156871 RepID=UPI003453A8A9